MNLYTLSRRATSTTHPPLLHAISCLLHLACREAADYSKDSTECQRYLPWGKSNPEQARVVPSGYDPSTWFGLLRRFFQLLQDRRVFQGRHILRNRLALGQHAQQTAHDFAGAGFGEVVAEADFLGFCDRADFLADPVAQLQGQLLRFLTGGAGLLQDYKGADRLTRRIVRAADNCCFGHQRVGHQGRFDFHRSHAVAGNVQHVIDAARDREVAGVLVADGAVAGQVHLATQFFLEVAGLETVRVVPDGAYHRWPRAFHDQNAALAVRHVMACFVDDGGHDAGQWQGAGTGHHRRGAWQWGDHVAARFRLPEGVDNRALLAADVFVVPHPCFRIDRLAHRTQQAQAAQIIVLRMHFRVHVGCLDQRTDGGWRRVEDADLMLFDGFPETARVRVGRDAFEYHLRGAHGHRAISDVAVARHPADVGRTPEHVVGLDVETPLHRQGGPQQVAAAGMLHAFRGAGRAGGVQNEQRMLGIDPFRLAYSALAFDQLMQPGIAARLHRQLAARALVDYDVFDGLAAAQRQRFVDDGFQWQLLAAAQLFVTGDDGHGACVDDALLQGFGGKAAEDDGVRSADARAGLHGGHAFDRHRHIDDDAVALGYPFGFQAVGELADFFVQFFISSLGNRAVVGFENDGGLVAQAIVDVAVQAVVGHVQLAVFEPFVERRVVFVQGAGERLFPAQVFARQLGPETFVVALGVGHHRVVGVHARDRCLYGECRRWIKYARLFWSLLLRALPLVFCTGHACLQCSNCLLTR